MADKPKQRAGTALITGASSGIGEALAARFARGGFDLVLVARSADKLNALAKSFAADHGVKAWVAVADLSLPGAAAQLSAAMKRARRPIDVLVNNAGVLEHGPFVKMPAQRHSGTSSSSTSTSRALRRCWPTLCRRCWRAARAGC